MRNTKIFILIAVLLTGFGGCIENTDNDDEWYEVRRKLLEIKWESPLKIDEEYDWREIWTFENNGNGTCESILIYKNGKEEKEIRYFLWVLTLDLVINIDDSRFWEIDKLTPEKLCVHETWDDPVEVPGQMYREYKEFTAQQ